MKRIRMFAGEIELAQIVDGRYEEIFQRADSEFSKPFIDLYEKCFYNIKNSKTFEERFELVQQGMYFCYEKPSVRLIAEEIPE